MVLIHYNLSLTNRGSIFFFFFFFLEGKEEELCFTHGGVKNESEIRPMRQINDSLKSKNLHRRPKVQNMSLTNKRGRELHKNKSLFLFYFSLCE